MSYIEGRDLRAMFQKSKTLGQDQVAELARKLVRLSMTLIFWKAAVASSLLTRTVIVFGSVPLGHFSQVFVLWGL